MDDLTLGVLLLVGGWALVCGLALADAHLCRRAPAEPLPAGPAPAWAGRALWVGFLLVALVRAPLAIGRELGNVDEYQYAAHAAFASASGLGLLGAPVGARGVTALWLLGDPWDPWLPHLLTSFAVAGTGLLLGQTLLRALGRPGPALLVALAYPWGLLRFEGLTSCAESWAALGLAGWVRLRLAAPDELSSPRRLLAGACLGLAVLMKEHALPFLLLVPAFVGLELRALSGPDRRQAFFRRVGIAWLGALIPLGLVGVGLLLRGSLGDLLQATFAFGRGLGDPGAVGAAPAAADGPFELVLGVAAGLAALLPAAVSGLGLVQLVRRAGELGAPAATPELRLAHGLTLLGLIGLACTALGLRFFAHYFQLALPALAALFAWRVSDAWRQARDPRHPARWLAAALLGLVALLLVTEARHLARFPRFARGNSLELRAPPGELSEAELLRRFAAAAAEKVPPGRPVLVWGWRPELYAAIRRPPASRWLAGWLLRVPPARILDDLERWPPAAVLLPGEHGLRPGAQDARDDPYELARHPQVLEWLKGHGYRETGRLAGYRLWLERGSGQ